jgi:hypothetical protein
MEKSRRSRDRKKRNTCPYVVEIDLLDQHQFDFWFSVLRCGEAKQRIRCYPNAYSGVRAAGHKQMSTLIRGTLGQPGTSSASEVSGRSHSEACVGCMVSLTTPSTSSLRAARSVSSRNWELKAASVLAASYFLL